MPAHPAIMARRREAMASRRNKLGMTYDPDVDNIMALNVTPDAQYSEALETVAPNITTTITQQSSGGESWMDTLQRSLPALAATYQQKQILQIQLTRAQQGLPPLDPSAYGVGVSVGISPDLKNMLMLGGLALVALVIFSKKRG